jgi:L-ascorbate metabolism protein UlaG (beta-lactamase superfamily)
MGVTMLAGKQLIDDINARSMAPGEVAAWWLGQHGFVFKTQAGVLYLDAFLTNLPDRLVPPLLVPGDVTNATWIAGTHDHADHIDRDSWPGMAAASPGAKLIVPDLLLPKLASDLGLPRERFIGLDDGTSITLALNRVAGVSPACDADILSACDEGILPSRLAGVSPARNPSFQPRQQQQQQGADKMSAGHAGKMPATHEGGTPSPHAGGTPASQREPHLTIHALASAHEFLDRDAATGKYPYLGFVIDAGGCTFYHAGDCCLYEGLITKLKAFSPRAMFLPINGRDARRLRANCIGNMTYQEAADLAGAVGCKLVVPTHYDMFAMNLGPADEFADYIHVKYPAMQVLKPNYGECFTF